MRSLLGILVILGVILPFSASAQVNLPPVDAASLSGDIRVSGSSVLTPMAQSLATLFGLEGFLGNIIVEASGSEIGLQQFCNGQVDIALADRQILPAEADACRAAGRSPIGFQVATDAVLVVASPQNTFINNLSIDELQRIFSTANSWSEIRPDWPDTPIQRRGPGTTSSEFRFFAAAVFGGDGRSMVTALGSQYSDDVAAQIDAVATDGLAIGFFDAEAVNANIGRLRVIAIAGVTPTDATVINGQYVLANPLLLYSAASVMQEQAQVAGFINFYLTNATREARLEGLFPSSPAALTSASIDWQNASSAAVVSPPAQPNQTTPPTPVPAITEEIATNNLAAATPTPETIEQIPPAQPTVPATIFAEGVLPLLVDARADLESLADELVGSDRPAGWSGSLDVNDPQLALLLRLDLETLASIRFGEENRPEDWFGAVNSTQLAVARDVRHDLEILAADVFEDRFIRPSGWAGGPAILRCNRSTQALVDLLQANNLFSIETIPTTLPNYCEQVELSAARFAEVNLLNPNAEPSSEGTTGELGGGGSLEIATSFAVAFSDRRATRNLGVVPQGESIRPLGRSFAQFSNMTLVEGDGFLVFVDWRDTTLTADDFDALPNADELGLETSCQASWCV